MKIFKNDNIKIDCQDIDDLVYTINQDILDFKHIDSITSIIEKYVQEDMIDNNYKINNKDILSDIIKLDKAIEKFLMTIKDYVSYISINYDNDPILFSYMKFLNTYSNFLYSYANYFIESNIDFDYKYEILSSISYNDFIKENIKKNKVNIIFNDMQQYNVNAVTSEKLSTDKKSILLNFSVVFNHKVKSYGLTNLSHDIVMNSIKKYNIENYYTAEYLQKVLSFEDVSKNDLSKSILDYIKGNNKIFYIHLYNYFINISNDIINDNRKNAMIRYFIYCNTIQKNNNKNFINDICFKSKIMTEHDLSIYHTINKDIYQYKNIIDEYNIQSSNINHDYNIHQEKYSYHTNDLVNKYIENLPEFLTISLKEIKEKHTHKMVVLSFLFELLKDINNLNISEKNKIKINKILFSEPYIEASDWLHHCYKLNEDYESKNDNYNKSLLSTSDQSKLIHLINLISENTNIYFDKKLLEGCNIVNIHRYSSTFKKLINNIKFYKTSTDKVKSNILENKQDNEIDVKLLNYKKEVNSNDNIIILKNKDIEKQYNEIINKFSLLNNEKYIIYLSSIDIENIKNIQQETNALLNDNSDLYMLSSDENKINIVNNVCNQLKEINNILEEKLSVIRIELEHKINLSNKIIKDYKIERL